jgi:hypothetical protein
MLEFAKTRQYWMILCVQVFLFFITPFMPYHDTLTILWLVCLFGVFGTVIHSIWRARLPRLVAILSAVVAVVLGVIGHLPEASTETFIQCNTVSCLAYALFVLMAIISIGKDVLVDQKNSLNAIIGSICIYIFLGYFFTFVFAACALSLQDSMHLFGIFQPRRPDAFADFMYFSCSTLTTIGFGDITATKPITRMIAAFEGVVGVL